MHLKRVRETLIIQSRLQNGNTIFFPDTHIPPLWRVGGGVQGGIGARGRVGGGVGGRRRSENQHPVRWLPSRV